MEAIEHPPIFHLPGIPDHVTYKWVVMIVLAALAFFASRRLELVPHGTQNLMEIVLEQIRGMIDDVMGPQGRPYLPLIATLAEALELGTDGANRTEVRMTFRRRTAEAAA